MVAGCCVSDLALGSAGAGAGATGSSATLASAAYRLLVGIFEADMVVLNMFPRQIWHNQCKAEYREDTTLRAFLSIRY